LVTVTGPKIFFQEFVAPRFFVNRPTDEAMVKKAIERAAADVRLSRGEIGTASSSSAARSHDRRTSGLHAASSTCATSSAVDKRAGQARRLRRAHPRRPSFKSLIEKRRRTFTSDANGTCRSDQRGPPSWSSAERSGCFSDRVFLLESARARACSCPQCGGDARSLAAVAAGSLQACRAELKAATFSARELAGGAGLLPDEFLDSYKRGDFRHASGGPQLERINDDPSLSRRREKKSRPSTGSMATARSSIRSTGTTPDYVYGLALSGHRSRKTRRRR
jgi:hypothetical protein